LLHVVPPQQVCPVPPQHVPVVHVPPAEHAPVFATHLLVPGSQHPPVRHAVPPVQHAWPAVPHGGSHVPLTHLPPVDAHVAPLMTQVLPVSQHPPSPHVPVPPSLLGQQVCVAAPQFWQVPPTHVPVVHGLPAATH
jgi:hypothetical protein